MRTDSDRSAVVHSAYVPLRILFGLVPIVAGLDKFTNLLVDWKKYIAPSAEHLLPVSPSVFMGIVGVIEIVVGVLVLTHFVRYFAYVAAAWLVLIASNLILAGYLDVAVRDLGLAVGAFALGRLALLETEPFARTHEATPGPRDARIA